MGDRYTLHSRDITFEAPAEWIYRASRLPGPTAPKDDKQKQPGEKEGKDGKAGAMLLPLYDLDTMIQPVLQRGKLHGA